MNLPVSNLFKGISVNDGSMLNEIVELTSQDDERVWVPDTAPNCWMRPLMFDLTNGHHVEIFKVHRGGVLGRHLHPTPVHGFVLNGQFRYFEHDWVADTGGYVFEPPGEVHTLTCDSVDEMKTLFFIMGPIIYMDDDDKVVFVDDNRQMIERCRAHYAQNGLGADYVDRLIR
ncbi:MAG: 2,4'-dihydroxyacetophenone dioxygenase family protein [Pseudomonadota bacterium]